MLPKLNLVELTDHIERASKQYAPPAEEDDIDNTSSKLHFKMPPIPPRISGSTSLPENPNDKLIWYVVLSPREIKGPTGPFSVVQLRHLYKSGEIHDRSLVWKPSDSHWEPIQNQPVLRPKLVEIPVLPPRVGQYNAELDLFDPIIGLPSAEEVGRCVDLPGGDVSKACYKCGELAVAHIPGFGEQIPDLFKGREEVGTTEYASEVLPGLLWVGNSTAAKPRNILNLGITLLINCTSNFKNPEEKLPFFRCKRAAFDEKPQANFSHAELQIMLQLLETVYDWIELERVSPEKSAKGDPTPKPYRGPTDELGMPIKVAGDRPFRRLKKEENEKSFSPRVLVWSRYGMDRCCVIAAAYMIKHYGITVDRSLAIVRKCRTTMKLSAPYRPLLEEWGRKYTLGTLLCIDCKTAALLAPVGEGEQPVGVSGRRGSVAGSSGHENILDSKRIQKVNRASMESKEEGESASGDAENKGQERTPRRAPANFHEELLQRVADHPDLAHLAGSEFATTAQMRASSAKDHSPQRPSSSLSTSSSSRGSTAAAGATGSRRNSRSGGQRNRRGRGGNSTNLLNNHETLANRDPCLQKILLGVNERSRWSGLVDLHLQGQYLGDTLVRDLFRLFRGSSGGPALRQRLRSINLEGNKLQCEGVHELLKLFFPIASAEDDDPYYLDLETRLEHLAVMYNTDCGLTELNLANNCLTTAGAEYLSYLLRQCNSITSLDLTANHLPDEGAAVIVQSIGRPMPLFQDYGDNGSLTPYNSVSPYQDDATSVPPSLDFTALDYGELPIHNYSLTELKIGYNQLGEQTAQALTYTLKNNIVLRTLHLDGAGRTRSSIAGSGNRYGASNSFFWGRGGAAGRTITAAAVPGIGSAKGFGVERGGVLWGAEGANSPHNHFSTEQFGGCGGSLGNQNSRIAEESSSFWSPADFKQIGSTIKMYNSVLERISLANSMLSVKALKSIVRIVDSPHTFIQWLDLSSCGLTHLHMKGLFVNLLTAQHLTYLDLSGNKITDKGAALLAGVVQGRIISDDNYNYYSSSSSRGAARVCPPITSLDLNNCGLGPTGCAMVVCAAAMRGREQLEMRQSVLDVRALGIAASGGGGGKVDSRKIDWEALAERLAASHINNNSCMMKQKQAGRYQAATRDSKLPGTVSVAGKSGGERRGEKSVPALGGRAGTREAFADVRDEEVAEGEEQEENDEEEEEEDAADGVLYHSGSRSADGLMGSAMDGAPMSDVAVELLRSKYPVESKAPDDSTVTDYSTTLVSSSSLTQQQQELQQPQQQRQNEDAVMIEPPMKMTTMMSVSIPSQKRAQKEEERTEAVDTKKSKDEKIIEKVGEQVNLDSLLYAAVSPGGWHWRYFDLSANQVTLPASKHNSSTHRTPTAAATNVGSGIQKQSQSILQAGAHELFGDTRDKRDRGKRGGDREATKEETKRSPSRLLRVGESAVGSWSDDEDDEDDEDEENAYYGERRKGKLRVGNRRKSTNRAFFRGLSCLRVDELHLNSCSLLSSGADEIFWMLTPSLLSALSVASVELTASAGVGSGRGGAADTMPSLSQQTLRAPPDLLSAAGERVGDGGLQAVIQDGAGDGVGVGGVKEYVSGKYGNTDNYHDDDSTLSEISKVRRIFNDAIMQDVSILDVPRGYVYPLSVIATNNNDNNSSASPIATGLGRRGGLGDGRPIPQRYQPLTSLAGGGTNTQYSFALLNSVRYLHLSENEVSDSVAFSSLSDMLSANLTLIYLDLGFNKLTNQCAKPLKQAIALPSDALRERKVYDLSVNLIGNACDPYALEMPGHARSKCTFHFGVDGKTSSLIDEDFVEKSDQIYSKGGENPMNLGSHGPVYSHIPHRARGPFYARKAVYEVYKSGVPTPKHGHRFI